MARKATPSAADKAATNAARVAARYSKDRRYPADEVCRLVLDQIERVSGLSESAFRTVKKAEVLDDLYAIYVEAQAKDADAGLEWRPSRKERYVDVYEAGVERVPYHVYQDALRQVEEEGERASFVVDDEEDHMDFSAPDAWCAF